MKSHILNLKHKHLLLDKLVKRYTQLYTDNTVISILKKQKLLLKEKIFTLEYERMQDYHEEVT